MIMTMVYAIPRGEEDPSEILVVSFKLAFGEYSFMK